AHLQSVCRSRPVPARDRPRHARAAPRRAARLGQRPLDRAGAGNLAPALHRQDSRALGRAGGARVKALLTGMEWLPDEPGNGGLKRDFHGLVQSLPSVGVSGTALVSYLKSPPTPAFGDDFQVLPMAAQQASIVQRWKGARAAARACFRTGGTDL